MHCHFHLAETVPLSSSAPDKTSIRICKDPISLGQGEPPYDESYREAVIELKDEYGIEAVVTGDISYVDDFHGNWIDEVCKGTGVQVIKPLWEKPRKEFMEELLANKFKVTFTCVKEPWLTEDWVGKVIDPPLLKNLEVLHEKNGLDLCGENGEYHTMTLDAPFFTKAVQVRKFETKKTENGFIMEALDFGLAAK